MPGAPASTRWSNSSSTGWSTDALSRSHRHSREPRSARRLPRRRAGRGYDQTLVLGDLVGYGADPNAVVERVQALEPVAIVRGNHDKVACGLEQAEGFNAVAKSAAHWTLDVLTPDASRLALRAARRADRRRRRRRDLPRLAVRRGRLHLRRARRRARAEGGDAAALPVRPHALPGHLRAVGRMRSTASGPATAPRRTCRCATAAST